MTKELDLFLKTFPSDLKNYNRMALNRQALGDSRSHILGYIQLTEYHNKQKLGETNFEEFSVPGLEGFFCFKLNRLY